LADTVTARIIERDTEEVLGLVKYEPTQGTIDIAALRQYYSSKRIDGHAIVMSEPKEVNPSSALVGIGGKPVTFEGYSFYGKGHSYSGYVDGYYGELMQTPKGWVFKSRSSGRTEPVGSNADVIRLVMWDFKVLDREIEFQHMRSN
jgi:hypothetical protein